MNKNKLAPPLTPTPTAEAGHSSREATENIVMTLRLSAEQRETLLRVLDELDEDPVLIIKPRDTWIPPPNINAADILEDIATWEMGPNKRRDMWPEARHWLYRFELVCDIVSCQHYIRNRHPYAFGLSDRQIALGIQQIPNFAAFADTVIVNKPTVQDNDVFKYPFFTS